MDALLAKGLSLQGDERTGSSTKQMLLGFAAASQISPRNERSSPRIVCSPFVSACLVLRKETFKSWQRFENVLWLLWAIQNPLKEVAIFHLMLSGSRWKIALKMAEPFKAEESLADASSAASPVAQICTWCMKRVRKHSENLQCFLTSPESAVIQPLHVGKDLVCHLRNRILLEPKMNIREL